MDSSLEAISYRLVLVLRINIRQYFVARERGEFEQRANKDGLLYYPVNARTMHAVQYCKVVLSPVIARGWNGAAAAGEYQRPGPTMSEAKALLLPEPGKTPSRLSSDPLDPNKAVWLRG